MYKTLVVHFTEGDPGRARITAAVELAGVHDAHIVGLYTIPDLLASIYTEVPIPNDLYQLQRDKALAAAADNKSWFDEQLRHAGRAGEWRAVEGGAGDYHLSRAARHADLVLMGRSDGDGLLSEDGAFVGRVVLSAPAPVMVIPPQWAGPPLGKRVLIAWNGSREVVRAVADAWPLLGKAERVSVVTVSDEEPSSPSSPAGQLFDYLALHDVPAEAGIIAGSGGEVGEKLFRYASDSGCDLLIAGGYGHSRLREAVFGGATQHMLKYAQIPVMMSH